jgi:hypothetical protein
MTRCAQIVFVGAQHCCGTDKQNFRGTSHRIGMAMLFNRARAANHLRIASPKIHAGIEG